MENRKDVGLRQIKASVWNQALNARRVHGYDNMAEFIEAAIIYYCHYLEATQQK